MFDYNLITNITTKAKVQSQKQQVQKKAKN